MAFGGTLTYSGVDSKRPSFQEHGRKFTCDSTTITLSSSALLSRLGYFLGSATTLAVVRTLSPALGFRIKRVQSLPYGFNVSTG